MSAVNVNALYPIFTDIDGQPLEDGYVWIGVSGLEPQANPQTAYWDAALTQVATQPVRTRGGYPLNGTAIGRLFTGAPYSIKVQNKRTSTIATDLSASAGAGVGSISFGSTGLTPAVPTDGDVVVAGTLAVANGGTGVTTSTGTGSVVRATSPSITGPTVSSGNLTFSGTAQRITGDMSNATLSNRLLFQTSTVNGATVFGAIPNGTGTITQFAAYGGSDPANAQVLRLDTRGGSESRIEATFAGTPASGTYLPMTFYTSGTEKLRIAADTTGTYTFGGTAPRITGDFSNATQSSRLAFQTSTTNAGTIVNALPNGTGTNGVFQALNSSDANNSSYMRILCSSTDSRLDAGITGGTGTFLPMTFFVNGSEAMRIQTSRNVSIGSTADNGNLFVSGANTRVRFSNTAGTASTLLFGADSASVFLGAETNAPIYFITNNTERVRVDTLGNVGIGTASPGYRLDVRAASGAVNIESTTTTNITYLNFKSVGFNYVGVESSTGGSLFTGTAAYSAVLGTVSPYPVALATNGAERMRIDSSGNVLIGADTASGTGRLQVFAPDGGATIRVMRFSNDASPAQLLLRKNRGAAATSFTAVQNGDNCGNIVGQGADGSAYGNLGSIAFNADGNASAGSTPGLISFATTPSGSNTSTERLRISASGNVVQGTAAVATTATDGFLWITSCAGAPTGAPTAPYTNAAALVCDTTNNRLYVRVGTTWRYTALI